MNLLTDSKVYIADVGPLKDEALFSHYYSLLPESRKRKTDAYRFDKDRRLSVGAGALLEKALADAGIESRNLIYSKTEYEKPYFENLPEFRFNLSHSHDRVMCIVSPYICGCDVEAVRSSDIELAERFFSPDEYSYLKAIDNEQTRSEEFIRIWTLKESYIKANGGSIAYELPSFSVISGSGQIAVRTGDSTFFEFDLKDGYKYSACISDAGASSEPSLEIVNL